MKRRLFYPFVISGVLFYLLRIQAAESQSAENTAQAPLAVTLTGVVTILATFGAFGGILAALSEASLRDVREQGIGAYGTFGRMFFCLIIGALWGTGGALAFGIIASLDHKFDSFNEAKRIHFALLSVASGFGGLQLLILFRRRLSKEVEEAIDTKTEKVRVEITEATAKQTKQLEELNTSLNALHHALTTSKDDPLLQSIVRDARCKGERAFLVNPAHRTLAIFLARLEFQYVGLDEAIKTLSQAIAEWNRRQQPLDADFAALLYNRACYKNIKADGLKGSEYIELAEELRMKAWEDLQQSFRLDPGNLEEAKNDVDLGTLINGSTRKWELHPKTTAL